MTGRAVDKMSVGVRLQVLHRCKLLIDGAVHHRHIASAELRPLVVLGEVLLYMAVFAGDAQGSAIPLVHDQKQAGGRNLLEKIDLDILENLS